MTARTGCRWRWGWRREKSLLRAAVADTLPQSVVQRVKAPYPQTQDPGYVVELQRQAAAVQQRFALERLLDTAVWFDTCRPTLRL